MGCGSNFKIGLLISWIIGSNSGGLVDVGPEFPPLFLNKWLYELWSHNLTFQNTCSGSLSRKMMPAHVIVLFHDLPLFNPTFSKPTLFFFFGRILQPTHNLFVVTFHVWFSFLFILFTWTALNFNLFSFDALNVGYLRSITKSNILSNLIESRTFPFHPTP